MGLHFPGIYHALNESRLYNLEPVWNNNAKRFHIPLIYITLDSAHSPNLFFFSSRFFSLIKRCAIPLQVTDPPIFTPF